MPEISRFYGIVISINYRAREHNPPHFHVAYGDFEARYNINTLEKINGNLPKTAEGLVMYWATLHKIELLRIWETQEFSKIEPLE